MTNSRPLRKVPLGALPRFIQRRIPHVPVCRRLCPEPGLPSPGRARSDQVAHERERHSRTWKRRCAGRLERQIRERKLRATTGGQTDKGNAGARTRHFVRSAVVGRTLPVVPFVGLPLPTKESDRSAPEKYIPEKTLAVLSKQLRWDRRCRCPLTPLSTAFACSNACAGPSRRNPGQALGCERHGEARHPAGVHHHQPGDHYLQRLGDAQHGRGGAPGPGM
jgi:hypothetical protein